MRDPGRPTRQGRVGRRLALAVAVALPPWLPFAYGTAQETAGGGRLAEGGSTVLHGTVVDAESETPVTEASVVASRPGGPSFLATTGPDGAYRFDGLARGRWELTVERLGYRPTSLRVTLERPEPLFVTVRVEPVPFRLGAIASRVQAVRGPSLVPPSPAVEAGEGRTFRRSEAVRERQRRLLSPDARQVSHADLRESNTLAEDDLFRALQRLPGVGIRDDYGADLWTRGAPAGQTAVFFDGIPLLGGLHALGAFGGLNPDMLGTATFQPGVAGAPSQGGGAAVLDVTSRSRTPGDGSGMASLSPASARLALDGEAGGRAEWAVGLRRSYLDALTRLARGMGLSTDAIPYAFGDATARVDLALDARSRVEASAFWQRDQVSGDVDGLAWGNEGAWGTLAVRASLLTATGSAVIRHTAGLSHLEADLEADLDSTEGHDPLHPSTESGYQTLVWESRVDGYPGPDASWSLGLRATRETHTYEGPGVDLARLLSAEELERRGIGDLTPVIAGLQRARLRREQAMTRVAVWGETRRRVSASLEVEGGLRVETGDPVQGRAVRFAPRLRVRWSPDGSGLSVAAGYGRAYQYVQTLARTDVLRPGLRASEVRIQAVGDTPALRSDVFTLGGEAWTGPAWLFGATLWLRSSGGILTPDPTPGVIDGPRPTVAATGHARGLEISARKLEGRVRGFANYSLSRSRRRVGARAFDASEGRRHVANLGVMADLRSSWTLGATLRAMSGAPYTRITLVDGACEAGLGCESAPRVLWGAPGLQRAPGYVGFDLSTEWTHRFRTWSLAVYGQLRNVLGSPNEITYHSSCVCVTGGGAGTGLRDRFDRGLPRLPVVGLRARF